MKHIGYLILLGSVLCLLGTIGEVEHSGMSLLDGILRSLLCFAFMLTGIKIIKKTEENKND